MNIQVKYAPKKQRSSVHIDVPLTLLYVNAILRKFSSDNKGNSSSKRKKKKGEGGDDDKRGEEDILFYNLYTIANRVHCDFCEKDITKYTRVICAVCKDLDICANCFASGQEDGRHLRSHDYHIVNKLDFPLFDAEWSAEEELMLIDGVERFGFGNWADIAEQIASPGKPKEECQQHYEQLYMSAPKFIPSNVRLLTRRDEKTSMLIYKPTIVKEPPPPPPPPPAVVEPPPPPTAVEEEKVPQGVGDKKDVKGRQLHRTAGPALTPQTKEGGEANAAEIVGYMPLRGDFDVEYDNDAELLLAEMEFGAEDTPEEIELKFKVLDIYNSRLDERIKRKKFVIERNLLDFKKQYQLDRNRSKEEKEIYNLMKVFARFNTPDEHEKLVQGIIKERQLRARIEELRHYHKIGLKTYEEVEQYLAEKRKRDDIYQKKQRQHDNFIYELNNRFSPMARRTRFKADAGEGTPGSEKKKSSAMQLSELESKLCEQISLSPYEYLLIKDILVRECVKEGLVSREFVTTTFSIEKDRAMEIFDFLVANKLILEKTKSSAQKNETPMKS